MPGPSPVTSCHDTAQCPVLVPAQPPHLPPPTQGPAPVTEDTQPATARGHPPAAFIMTILLVETYQQLTTFFLVFSQAR